MTNRHPRILVCPLEWGLGHATRCIPLIRDLRQRKVEVVIGADGLPLELLQKEFPDAPYVQIPGYRVRYPGKKGSMSLKMLRSLPRLFRSIKAEHRGLERFVEKGLIDAVISDNRYGLWNSKIPSIFMSHQLQVQAPSPVQQILNRLNHHFIKRYDECWVPDEPDERTEGGLGGKLSHGDRRPEHLRYLGILSRFEGMKGKTTPSSDLTLLLSGPEPQRTYLEGKLVEQSRALTNLKITLLRGLPGKQEPLQVPEHVTVHDHLSSQSFLDVLLSSQKVLCRPGYSTLMDLAITGKAGMLVPTPGQTEQEYLASYHMGQGHHPGIPQEALDLAKALQGSEDYSGLHMPPRPEWRKAAITSLLEKL